MDAIVKISKNLMVVALLLGTTVVAGCNRNKSSDTPPATEGPAAGGTAGTAGTTTPESTGSTTMTPGSTGSTTTDTSGATAK